MKPLYIIFDLDFEQKALVFADMQENKKKAEQIAKKFKHGYALDIMQESILVFRDLENWAYESGLVQTEVKKLRIAFRRGLENTLGQIK